MTGMHAAFAANIVHFARGLRRAGLPIGSDQVMDALRAVNLIDLTHRDELYWSLASVLVDRQAQLELFDMAFTHFFEQRALAAGVGESPKDQSTAAAQTSDIAQRVLQAFAPTQATQPQTDAPPDETPDATFSASQSEQLRNMDFESMGLQEMREARHMLARLRLSLPEVNTRRFRTDPGGRRVDLRASLHAGLRGQADLLPLVRRALRRQRPPLVVLCDISGSMNRYATMLLYFLHAITNDRDRIHVFLFGTRLTNITRQLRHRDVDTALGAVARVLDDWSGGTRIGASLTEFNLRWSRRVLGQNAAVLLITDGLERDGIETLRLAMERLHKSCARLVWLNPLLRYAGFEPLAEGIRTMLAHVDEFRPAHNVRSLMDLAQALSPHQKYLNNRTHSRWK